MKSNTLCIIILRVLGDVLTTVYNFQITKIFFLNLNLRNNNKSGNQEKGISISKGQNCFIFNLLFSFVFSFLPYLYLQEID